MSVNSCLSVVEIDLCTDYPLLFIGDVPVLSVGCWYPLNLIDDVLLSPSDIGGQETQSSQDAVRGQGILPPRRTQCTSSSVLGFVR